MISLFASGAVTMCHGPTALTASFLHSLFYRFKAPLIKAAIYRTAAPKLPARTCEEHSRVVGAALVPCESEQLAAKLLLRPRIRYRGYMLIEYPAR